MILRTFLCFSVKSKKNFFVADSPSLTVAADAVVVVLVVVVAVALLLLPSSLLGSSREFSITGEVGGEETVGIGLIPQEEAMTMRASMRGRRIVTMWIMSDFSAIIVKHFPTF